MAALTIGNAQAQISDDVVKIGILNDMSSIYADGAGKASVAAAELAIEDAIDPRNEIAIAP